MALMMMFDQVVANIGLMTLRPRWVLHTHAPEKEGEEEKKEEEKGEEMVKEKEEDKVEGSTMRGQTGRHVHSWERTLRGLMASPIDPFPASPLYRAVPCLNVQQPHGLYNRPRIVQPFIHQIGKPSLAHTSLVFSPDGRNFPENKNWQIHRRQTYTVDQ